MNKRTWTYGEQRRGTVGDVQSKRFGDGPAQYIVTIIDDQNEGHILVGDSCVYDGIAFGDKVILTFTKGGPTGGFWKASKAA